MDADNFWFQSKIREIQGVSSGGEKIPKPYPIVEQIWKCLQACTQKTILSHPFLIFGSPRNPAALKYIVLNLSLKLVFGDILNVVFVFITVILNRESLWSVV